MSRQLLGVLVGIAVLATPYIISQMVEAANRHREATRNRPLSMFEQYALMNRRRSDTLRRMRQITRDHRKGQ